MKPSIATILALCAAAAFGASGARAGENLVIELEAAPRSRSPVRAVAEVPDSLADARVAVFADEAGGEVVAQIASPGLLRAKGLPPSAREIVFFAPETVAPGARFKSAKWIRGSGESSLVEFRWTPARDETSNLTFLNLTFGDRPVLRYMHTSLDASSPERREETYKPFHHVFDPAGSSILTKGPGGLYTHHRGLFLGFNKISYGEGRSADVWHCKGKAGQIDAGDDSAPRDEDVGPVFGRHRREIRWLGQEGEPFARETRETTAYAAPGGLLIEFASRVETLGGEIRLDGDPQHAGFHFRASNEVADKTKGETYYLRPDGKGAPGETRNWPDRKDHVDLPWNALSFVVGGKRYTAIYLDRPDNPKEARFSERDYGRFGSYFEYTIAPDKPLEVAYRVRLIEGETTVEEARAWSEDFADPVGATARWE